jgi:WD40 repeat protein
MYHVGTDRGAFTCAFSQSGIYIAVASVNATSYPIKIYEVLTGNRIATLEGHLDLVYQLSWSTGDNELLSSSSDGSCRVWEFKCAGQVRESRILQHPAFVYTGVYYPNPDTAYTFVT